MGRLSDAPQLSCIPVPISNLLVNEFTSLLGSHGIPDMQIVMPPASRGLPRRLPENFRAPAPKCPSPGLRQNSYHGVGLVLCMQRIQRLSHCIEPNLCVASTEPSRVHLIPTTALDCSKNKLLESAPRTRMRECSRPVSTRADVLLHVPVDALGQSPMGRRTSTWFLGPSDPDDMQCGFHRHWTLVKHAVCPRRLF